MEEWVVWLTVMKTVISMIVPNCHECNFLSQRYHTYFRIFTTKRKTKLKTTQELQDSAQLNRLNIIPKGNKYTTVHLGQDGKTNWNCTWGPDNSNSAKEGSSDRDDLGDACSVHNTQYCQGHSILSSQCVLRAPG